MMNDEDSWRALRIKTGPGQAFRAASIVNVLSQFQLYLQEQIGAFNSSKASAVHKESLEDVRIPALPVLCSWQALQKFGRL